MQKPPGRIGSGVFFFFTLLRELALRPAHTRLCVIMSKRPQKRMYWDADNPTESEADVTFRFYGWTYFRFETWELEWSHDGVQSFYAVKLWKLRFMVELVGT